MTMSDARGPRSALALLIAAALLVPLFPTFGEGPPAQEGIGAPNSQQRNLPPLPEVPIRMDSFTLTDATGATRPLADFAGKSATVIVFLYDNCPMCKRVAPILQELQDKEGARGAQVVGVFIKKSEAHEIEKFRKEYGLTFPLLFDTDGQLASALSATVVPEAVVLDRDGRVRYCGRIDDGYQVRGVKSQAPVRQDLAEAVAEVLAGAPVRTPRTLAVGCAIDMLGKSAPAAPVPVQEVTYHKDVAPILREHCMACHSPGNAGPFPLLTYDDAADMMRVGLQEIRARRMPPAQVESDLEMIRKNTLTPQEIETIQAWIKAGKPEGDPATATPLEPLPDFSDFEKELGPPDIVIEQGEPFHLGPVGSDVYRNLIFPLNRDEDLRVRAIQMIPSDRSIVHHSLLGYLPHEAGQEALRRHGGPGPTYAEGDSGPGFWDVHGLGFRAPAPRADGIPLSTLISGYVPGGGYAALPDDTDFVIPAGSDLLAQMHYHRNGKQSQDSSRIGLWLRKGDKAPQKIATARFMHGEMVVIPAGIKNMKVSGEWTVPVDCTIVGIAPHAHMLARSLEITADIPGRGHVLIARVPRWEYDWQQPYTFREPFHLPKGTKLTCSAVFDNSAENPKNPFSPPQPVFLGESTTDEMLLPWLFLSSEKVIGQGDASGIMGFVALMNRSSLLREFYHDRLPFEVQPDGTVLRVGYTTSENVFHRFEKPTHPAIPESEFRKN
jgi:peroxiredoxin